jgi:hypothetical protein
MMHLHLICLVPALLLSGCSVIPDLPDNEEMPVQAILYNAVCELRTAFIALSDKRKYPNFKADQWAASISLTPKVDTEVSARLGATGQPFSNPKSQRFVTWTLGRHPGLNSI